jgi:hypothetical protein
MRWARGIVTDALSISSSLGRPRVPSCSLPLMAINAAKPAFLGGQPYSR